MPGAFVSTAGRPPRGSLLTFECLMKRPHRPFKVDVSYVTKLGVERTLGRITVRPPKARRKRARR